MATFFKNPIVHAVATFLILIASVALAHFPELGQITLASVITGAVSWIAKQVA